MARKQSQPEQRRSKHPDTARLRGWGDRESSSDVEQKEGASFSYDEVDEYDDFCLGNNGSGNGGGANFQGASSKGKNNQRSSKGKGIYSQKHVRLQQNRQKATKR
jgi:hypothetical protein